MVTWQHCVQDRLVVHDNVKELFARVGAAVERIQEVLASIDQALGSLMTAQKVDNLRRYLSMRMAN